jgi:uncharacterized protein (DUF952 family)
MAPELLFYLVTKRKWMENNQNGRFKPENFDSAGSIQLISPEAIESMANSKFTGRKKVLLLVIDTNRVSGKIHKSEESGYYLLDEALNSDAILDKIELESNSEGRFEIEIEI